MKNRKFEKFNLSDLVDDPVFMDLARKMVDDVHDAMHLTMQLCDRREQKIGLLCLAIGNLLRGIEVISLSAEDEENEEMRKKVIDNAVIMIRRLMERDRNADTTPSS